MTTVHLIRLARRIDQYANKADNRFVKSWFSMLLLVGALLGLFAQETVFATAPVAQLTEQVSADETMNAVCMQAMGQSDEKSDAPCKGLTLDCIAKMGCALPLAQAPSGSGIANLSPSRTPPFLIGVRPMIGRDEAPIPDPPAILG